jgi:D-alanyl-D-alanine carboxypeptidase
VEPEAGDHGEAGRVAKKTRRIFGRIVGAILLMAVANATAQAQSVPHAELQLRLQAKLDSIIASTSIPGLTIGVAMPDGESFGLAAGVSDKSTHRRMNPSDLMLQGSVGKTYFTAVALQLVSEGRMELDARLAEYLGDEPWFGRLPNSNDVTIRQLMRHRSGIVRYEFNYAFLADLAADPMRTFTPVERLGYLFDSEAPFPAGEGWEYSDTNFILLAMVIEKITGRPAYDEIEDRLIVPLGYHATVPSDSPDIPGLAQGYAGGPENPFGDFDETMENGRMVINPQFEWGGGGFASTAEDLARWIQDFHIGLAFDEDLLDDVYDGVPAPLGPNAAYGLGTIMMGLPTSGTAFGHSGFMPGYRTEAYYFPDYGFALALQINSTARNLWEGPLLLLFDDIAHVVVRTGDFEGP